MRYMLLAVALVVVPVPADAVIDCNSYWGGLLRRLTGREVAVSPPAQALNSIHNQIAKELNGETGGLKGAGLAEAGLDAVATLKQQRDAARDRWNELAAKGDPGANAAKEDYIAKDNLLIKAEQTQNSAVGAMLSGQSNSKLRGRAVQALERSLNEELSKLSPSHQLNLLTQISSGAAELPESISRTLSADNELSRFGGSMRKVALSRLAEMQSAEAWKQVALGLGVNIVAPRTESTVSEHAANLFESGPWTQAKRMGLQQAITELSARPEGDYRARESLDLARKILEKHRLSQ